MQAGHRYGEGVAAVDAPKSHGNTRGPCRLLRRNAITLHDTDAPSNGTTEAYLPVQDDLM